METLYKLLLILHIFGGLSALLTGYGALWVKRGGPRHRQLGRWYVQGMFLVLLTGFPMSIIRPNPFLFGIVFFTGYFVISGRRAALIRTGLPERFDIILAAGLVAISALALVAIGIAHLSGTTVSSVFLITGGVFAIIGMFSGVADLKKFRSGPIGGKERIQRHLSNMCGALIATTTAVAVTMVSYVPAIPPLMAWLGPTVVISPLIAIWSRQIMQGQYKFE